MFDSLRADPRPIVNFGYDKLPNSNDLLAAQLTVTREAIGGLQRFKYLVPGYSLPYVSPDLVELNFWQIGTGASSAYAALQVDMRNQPTGRYDYALKAGLVKADLSDTALLGETDGSLLVVNSTDSVFGRGWGIAGLQEIVLNPDRSVILIDGDGTEQSYVPQASQPDSSGPIRYSSLSGDHSDFVFDTAANVYRRTMPDGTIYTFIHTSGTTVGANANQERYVLSTVVDPNFNKTTYRYDGAGRISDITDPVGLRTVFSYNSAGKVSTITDPANRVTHLEYDATGNLTKVTNPDGSLRNWSYNATGNMTTDIDERGGIETRTNDFAGRVINVIRADGSSFSVQALQTQGLFNPSLTVSPSFPPVAFTNGYKTGTYTNPNGNITTVIMDARGQIVSITDAFGTVNPADRSRMNDVVRTNTPSGHSTNLQYDNRGNIQNSTDSFSTNGTKITYDLGNHPNLVASVTDEAGRTSAFQHDNWGNTVSATSADGKTSRYTYTSNGQIESATDPLGRVTAYVYDTYGRVITVTTARGTLDEGVQRFEYDQAGNVTARIDENGNRTEYEYDAANRVTLVRDAERNETRYEYDNAGNVKKVTDALGHVMRYDYDARNRLTRTIDEQNHQTSSTYDGAGNLITSTDQLGHTTTNKYDARNRLIRTTDAAGHVTQYAYDIDNNRTAVIDAKNNHTIDEYDGRGRLVRETDPLGHVTVLTYNAADELVSKQDRNGRVTQYTYDINGRLAFETWVGGNEQITYQYDSAGQVTSVTDTFSSLTYTYDDRGRVKSVDNAGTPNAPHVVLNYTYDAVGNVKSVSETINGVAGVITAYEYNSLNRMTSVTQSGPGVALKRVDFHYNAIGQFDIISRYSDLAGTQVVATSNYNYDYLNRINALTHRNAIGAVLDFENLSYDFASRITLIQNADGDTGYSYDDTNQLTGATHTGTSGPNEAYTYDANGNRVALGGNASYLIGPGNQLLSDGTYRYSYDNEGNLHQRTTIATGVVRDFTWDYRNRLISVTDRDASGVTLEVTYTYDTLNRRISKTVNTHPSNPDDRVVTHYVYDGSNVRLTFTRQGSGTDTLDQRYLHGPAVDQILAAEDATGSVLWSLTDHLGSVGDLIKTDGSIADHIVYDSFGQITSETTPTPFAYAFTGRELDRETGLQYNRARYYDPASGRFIGQDPISFKAGDANLYRYVGNRAPSATDPSGMYWSHIHFVFTYAAALSHGNDQHWPMAASMIWGLVAAISSVALDFVHDSQEAFAPYPYWHGMGPSDNREKNYQGTREFIKSQLATSRYNPISFGFAQHAIQDSYAGGHLYQKWEGGLPSLDHIKQDAIPSLAALQGSLSSEPARLTNLPMSKAPAVEMMQPQGIQIASGIYYYDPLSEMLQLFINGASSPKLDSEVLNYVKILSPFTQAITLWLQFGLTAEQRALLDTVRFEIADLPDGVVGLESPASERQSNIIQLDDDAGGRGWFVDSTPEDNFEYGFNASANEFVAAPGSPAYGRVDLLTVLSHELGHVLGLGHPDGQSTSVMASELATSVRRLPTAQDLLNSHIYSDATHTHFDGLVVVDLPATFDNPTTLNVSHDPLTIPDVPVIQTPLALHLADPFLPIGPAVNGNFTQGADQLFGWRTSNPAAVVVNDQHQAEISESATEMEVALFQDFHLPIGATTLSFTLSGLTFDSIYLPGYIPDAFGVSLEDPRLGTSIVSNVDAFTDSYYIRDLVSGVTEGLVAPGVSVTAGLEPGSFRITLDVHALANHDARLVFRLFGGSDGTQIDGSVRISEVIIANSTSNLPPTADAGADQTVYEGDLVTLQGRFTDPDAGDTHTFNWRVVSNNGQVIAEGTAQTFRFTPTDNGTYTATFTVTDALGFAASDSLTITVLNVAPTADFSSTGPVSEGTSGTVQFLHMTDVSSIDAQGAYLFSFDFDNDGTFEIVNSTSPSETVPAAYLLDGPSVHTVHGRITDKDGGSTDYRADVIVTNVPPTITSISGAQTIHGGQTVTVSGTLTDPAFGVSTETFAATAIWSDGFSTSVILTGSTFSTSRTFADDVPGGVTVKVTVFDDDGGQGSATSGLISVLNLPPTANPDSATTDEDTLLTVDAPGVLANDNDPAQAADPLSVVPFTGYSAHGAVVKMLADGSYTYNPIGVADIQALNDGETLTDTFTYMVMDGDGGTALGVVTITVIGRNESPTADAGADQTVNEGDLVTLQGRFTDPDPGDTHTFNWHVVSNNGQIIADGTAQTFRFTPTDNGTYTATFTVTDSFGFAASDSLTITVLNVAPTADFGGTGPVSEGTSGTVQFLHMTDVSSIDAQGTYLYSFDFDNDGTFEIVNSTSPSATVPATYLLDGPSVHTVHGRITDKDGGSTDYRADVIVSNVPPTITSISGAQTIHEGQTVTVSGTFTDPAFGVVTETFTATAIWSDGVSTSVILTGTTFSTSRTFADDVPGGVTVKVTVFDDDGGQGSATSGLVSVLNLPPTANPDSAMTDEDTLLTVDAPGVLANDNDPAQAADPLSVVPFTGYSAHGAVVKMLADGSYTYNPIGVADIQALNDGETLTDTFTYMVMDGDGGTALGVVTITVIGRNETPILPGFTFNLAENRPNGTIVGSVAEPNPGTGSRIYTILGGNTGGAFALSSTGLFTVANISALDYETTPLFTLSVGMNDGTTTFTMTVTVNLTNVNEVTGFDVQRNMSQRSFVRYQDLTFESSTGLSGLVDADSSRIKLTRYALNWNGTDPGTNVNLNGVISVVDSSRTLAFDFGAQGIGGNANSNAGDGYYVISLDLDGDGRFETVRRFYRLFGDANGDHKVDGLDASFILARLGQTGLMMEADTNGDGIVNSLDRTNALRAYALGATLAFDLWNRLDD